MEIFKIVLLSLFMTLMVVVSSVSCWVFVTNGLDPFTQFIGAMLMVLACLISWLAFYIVNATSGL